MMYVPFSLYYLLSVVVARIKLHLAKFEREKGEL